MLNETVILQHGRVIRIELGADLAYRLRYDQLIEYSNGRRRIRGRTVPYQFRSVEQLRYDFEQDIRRLEQGS
jgi:hypothetical protein